ncbi:ATP-binding protein [Actinoplanes sp. NPDC048796]|uniref:ATP-binding protein n=1 Tax=unclassified Actinoplanes TaxID=2626549 RepID=UPI003405B4B0
MPFDRTSLPPPGSVLLTDWTLAGSHDLRRLRADVADVLAGQRIPAARMLDAVPDKMSTAASELATNALCHGAPPTRVSLRRHAGAFIVDVTDADIHRFPVPVTGPTDGWGLRIVDGLADLTGWYTDEQVKHVWAQFTMPLWPLTA